MTVAFSGTQSYEVEFDFLDDTAAGVGSLGNWVRLTTFNTVNLPNAATGVPNTSLIPPSGTASFSMQVRVVSIPEPACIALALLAAIGAATLARWR